MEIFNTAFPENVHSVVLVANKEEFKTILSFLAEYQKATKARKRIQDVGSELLAAAEKGMCYLNNSKARILFDVIEEYSKMKEKSKRHKVHKYYKLFYDYFEIYT